MKLFEKVRFRHFLEAFESANSHIDIKRNVNSESTTYFFTFLTNTTKHQHPLKTSLSRRARTISTPLNNSISTTAKRYNSGQNINKTTHITLKNRVIAKAEPMLIPAIHYFRTISIRHHKGAANTTR
ncbi:hypothetical protein [Planctomicrobium sp. SH527]|uniref:hypothetical protein n=1 Tax=Planctomicrobium sp. SH527 TaxID=3448123 RepID=UPI003F5B24FF